MKRLRQIWTNFQTVRHGAHRPITVQFHQGGASFVHTGDSIRFGLAYCSLPKWLRKLALLTARRKP